MARSPRHWITHLAALALLTPLLVGHGVFLYPHVTPKVLFFRTMALVLVGAFLFRLLRGGPRPRPTIIGAAVAIFLASYVVSSLAGIDPRRSLLDTPARMLSFFTILSFAAFYVVLANSIRSWPEWRLLLRTLLVVGIVVSLAAAAQRFDLLPLHGPHGKRASSTLGNPIFLAGFAAFCAFMALPLLARERRRFWRWLSAGGIALAVVSVVLSQSRGTFLGLLAGGGVTLLGYRVVFRDRTRARRILNGAIASAVVLIAVVWLARDSAAVKGVPLLRRLAAASTETGSPQMRVDAWGVAMHAGRARPWLGCGPNTFYHAYNRFYRPEMALATGGARYLDQAHNVSANTFAVQGVPGLLAHLLLALAPLLVLVRKAERGQVDAHVAVAGLGYVAAQFVHGLFAVDEVASYLCAFLFLALVDGIHEDEAPPRAVAIRRPPRWFTGLGAIGVLAGIILGNVLPGMASAAAYRANVAVIEVSDDAPRLVAEAGRLPSAHAPHLRAHLAEAVSENLPRWIDAGRREEAESLLAEAWRGARALLRASPLDTRTAILTAAIAIQQAVIFDDPEHLAPAFEDLEAAREFAPNRQDLEFTMARMLLAMGRVEDALDRAEAAYDAEPRLPDSVWQYAALLARVGLSEDARNLVRHAVLRGVVFKGEAARFIADLLDD